jgi:hypothetical protein
LNSERQRTTLYASFSLMYNHPFPNLLWNSHHPILTDSILF